MEKSSGRGTNNKGELDRPMAAAGRFYPFDPNDLYSTLEDLFSHARPKTGGSVRAVVSPHAGYEFSGIVAASGFNQLDPAAEYENIFIIGSSHYIFFRGASVCHQQYYQSPLGKVKVNTGLAEKLVKENSIFCFNPEADRYEHCLEVQIPFLQFHLKKSFSVVPVVLGIQSAADCKNIAEALKPYFNRKNLFIFSTDFSHYPSYNDAVKVDEITCEAIVSNAAGNLLKVIEENARAKFSNLDTSLCGWTSVITMLYLTGEHPEIRLTPVHYMNSGDSVYADKRKVVGYWSIVAKEEALFFNAPD